VNVSPKLCRDKKYLLFRDREQNEFSWRRVTEMNRFKALAVASCMALASFGPSALADQWNKKTYMTINEPVQIPGKVLQPGKYVVRLLDSPSNRHVVQIFNENESQIQATVLAIPNYRLQPTGDTQFGFYETPAGQPKALRSWFYPGDNFGQEFAYPKTESVTIAAASNTTVPTTYAQTEADLTTAKVGTVDKAGTEMELDRQTYTQGTAVAQNTPPATTPATPAATPAPMTEQPAATMPAATPAATTLPRTGSPLPLVGMLGGLSLLVSAAMRRASKRS